MTSEQADVHDDNGEHLAEGMARMFDRFSTALKEEMSDGPV